MVADQTAHCTSPLTGEPIDGRLIPNQAIGRQIKAYCQQHAGGFPPVYCPADVLTACPPPDMSVERCTSNRTWHGIDSLELYELTKLNDTALRIRSLNGSFDDTTARVIIEPLPPPTESA